MPDHASSHYKNRDRFEFAIIGLAFLCFLCLSGCAISPRLAPVDEKARFKDSLVDVIRASGAEVGYALWDLETGQKVMINKKTLFHAASTMKVAVMIEVFRQAGLGRFGLEDPLPVRNQFPSLIDGSLYSLSPDDDSDRSVYEFVGKTLPIRKLVVQMITVSSNLATNVLLELVGVSRVMATLKGLGIRRHFIRRGLEDKKAYDKGLNNETDASSLMLVMESIASGRAGTASACREMEDILSRQNFRENIPAGLPEGVRVANKTGWITGINHDAAIVYPPGRKPYVLVVLTRGIEAQEQAAKLVAELSRLTYAFLSRLKKA